MIELLPGINEMVEQHNIAVTQAYILTGFCYLNILFYLYVLYVALFNIWVFLI